MKRTMKTALLFVGLLIFGFIFCGFAFNNGNFDLANTRLLLQTLIYAVILTLIFIVNGVFREKKSQTNR